jgi:hypothetical protein
MFNATFTKASQIEANLVNFYIHIFKVGSFEKKPKPAKICIIFAFLIGSSLELMNLKIV